MNEELSEYNYDQYPEKPKRSIAKSKRRKNGLGKWVIVHIVILLGVIGFMASVSTRGQTGNITVSQLVRDINAETVDSIKDIGDTWQILYKNNDTKTFSAAEGSEIQPSELAKYGANVDALGNVNLTYDFDTSKSFRYYFPIIYIINFAIMILVLFQIPKRIEEDLQRVAWAGIILFIPILGLVAFAVSTRRPMQPASSIS